MQDRLGRGAAVDVKKHACSAMMSARKFIYGHAITDIRVEDYNGVVTWVAITAANWGDPEYATEIKFCPFCGIELPQASDAVARDDE